MGATTATSLRRAWFAMCALAVTVCAHAATSDAVHLAPAAPLLWIAVFAAAFAIGSRVPVRQFRIWRGTRVVALLAGTQIASHLVLGAAPWLVGLTTAAGSGHHHHEAAAVLDLRSLIVHIVAATIIGCLLRSAQHRLVRLVRSVAHMVRDAFERVVPGTSPRGSHCIDDATYAVRLIGDALRSRGPPRGRPA